MAETKGMVSGGARLVWRRQSVLWWVFVVNLLLGLLGTTGMASRTGAILNQSLEARRLVHGLDLTVLVALLRQPSAPFQAGSSVLFAALVFFIFMLFVEGGILETYRQDQPLTKAEFFEASGRFFWRFVRLLLYSLILFVPVFLLANAVSDWSDKLSSDAGPALLGFWVEVAGLLLAGFLLTTVRLWFDLAQVHSVAEDQRAMHRALRRAFRLTFGNFASGYWMYLRITLVWWLGFIALLWVWVRLVRPTSVGASFVICQLIALLWVGTRLWQRASETLWYQAHAEAPFVPFEPAASSPLPPVSSATEAPGSPAVG